MRRKSRKVKPHRVGAHVKVRRGTRWDTGRVTAVEVNASGVHHYAVELANGVVESLPSYLVEAIPQNGFFERLRSHRLALPGLVAAGTLVTAGATLDVWLWPHASDARPATPATSKDVDSRVVGEESRWYERVGPRRGLGT